MKKLNTIQTAELAQLIKVDAKARIAQKKAEQAKQMVANESAIKPIKRLIATDYKCEMSLDKANKASAKSFLIVLGSIDYSNILLVSSVKNAISETFESVKDKAIYRNQCVNNLARIQKAGVPVGPVLASLVDVPYRDFKRIIGDAVPAEARSKSGGARGAKLPAKGAKTATAIKNITPVQAMPRGEKDALSAAIKVLEFTLATLQAEKFNDARDAIKECVEALKLAA